MAEAPPASSTVTVHPGHEFVAVVAGRWAARTPGIARLVATTRQLMRAKAGLPVPGGPGVDVQIDRGGGLARIDLQVGIYAGQPVATTAHAVQRDVGEGLDLAVGLDSVVTVSVVDLTPSRGPADGAALPPWPGDIQGSLGLGLPSSVASDPLVAEVTEIVGQCPGLMCIEPGRLERLRVGDRRPPAAVTVGDGRLSISLAATTSEPTVIAGALATLTQRLPERPDGLEIHLHLERLAIARPPAGGGL